MSLLSVARLAVFAATVAPYTGAIAQGLTISDVVNGKFPIKMAAADLPESFHAARIVSAGPVPSPMESLAPLMINSIPSSGPSLAFINVLDDSWTDGSIVMVENQRFLVTYRLSMSLTDLLSRGRQTQPDGSALPSVAPSQELKLVLVKVDGIQSIAPDPDLTKAKLLEALGAGQTGVVTPIAQASAKAATVSNLKQVALGMIMYTSDYDDVFPYPQSTKAVQYVTYPYLKDAKVWKTLNPNGGEIRFNMALGGVSASAIESPAETVLFYETKDWPEGGRVVAFTDGHVKILTQDQWALASKTLNLKISKTVNRPLPLKYGLTEIK